MQHRIYSRNLVAVYERREKKHQKVLPKAAMLIDGEKKQLCLIDMKALNENYTKCFGANRIIIATFWHGFIGLGQWDNIWWIF